MFFTADQLVLHAIGDYVLQSDWMAQEKVKKYWVASVHAWAYSTPFMFLTTSWKALLFISVTHALIDRYRLAKYIVYAKNFLAPWSTTERIGSQGGPLKFDAETLLVKEWWFPWSDCHDTGYHKDRPAWMAVWLMIIADNLMHITLNALALRYL